MTTSPKDPESPLALVPDAPDLSIEHDEQNSNSNDQFGTPPAELDPGDCTSEVSLVEAYGDIKEVWPDDCNNELPELGEYQSRTIVSSFVRKSISISFDEEPERRRAHSNMLPPALFRTHYETSNTLSRYVDKHTHPKHRSNIQLKIKEGYAFESIGAFHLERGLTRERIERHLVWNKKIDPSALISAFNDISHAKRRANFHYDDSQRIGHRVFVAQIKTAGLVAATIKARMKTIIEVTTKESLFKITVKKATKIRDITIPVWVRNSARPSDWSSITEKELIASGADMWTSITEIRKSDLKKHTPKIRVCDTIASKGHDYEWLACGFIPTSCIDKIMPWDGVKLHTNRNTRIVRSIGSPDPWVFDCKINMWRLDARLYRTACFLAVYGGAKRKDDLTAVYINKDLAEKAQKKPEKLMKARKSKKLTKTQKTMLGDNPYASGSAPENSRVDNDGLCCTMCGEKKAAFRLEDEVAGPLAYLDLASATKASPTAL